MKGSDGFDRVVHDSNILKCDIDVFKVTRRDQLEWPFYRSNRSTAFSIIKSLNPDRPHLHHLHKIKCVKRNMNC